MAENPTLVFIHGAWHTPECWDPVISQLEQYRYPIRNVALLSAGGIVSATVADDTAHIRKIVTELVDNDKEVILVMHSYAGIPGCNSTEGLLRKDRLVERKAGGVVSLVFVTAFVLPVGESMWSLLGAWPPWLVFDGDKMTAISADDILYHDLPESAREGPISKLVHQAKPSFYGNVSYPAYLEVPSWYLHCEQDKPIPISIQKKMVDSLGPIITTRTCNAGHVVMLSQPGQVTAIVREAAGECVA